MAETSVSNVLGVVIIGRNEGERLIKCIDSAKAISTSIIYVDSGSTDGSLEAAKAKGCFTVDLDLSIPFTAARARNMGWRALLELNNELEFIHFVDGDCEIIPSWVAPALAHLATNDKCGVVCGRRCERFPDASVYNQLCHIEWNTPIGEAKACGGDAIIKVEALVKVGGYRDDFIAGEEPELCLRIRQSGWMIQRIEADMTLHDAAMHHFTQWWKRTRRCGFAYALGAYVHGKTEEKHWVAETRRAVFWGGFLPTLIIFLGLFWPLLFFCFGIYFVQWFRLLKSTWIPSEVRKSWAFFTVLGKFPEFFGVCEFYYKKLVGKQMKLIEYK